MAGERDKNSFLRCSFCGKTQEEVKKLVAGPTVYICNECIALCNDILKEEDKGEAKSGGAKGKLVVPKPIEIKDILDELPRAYTKDLYEQKCDVVYQHFYEAYMGQGKSVYAGS